jgi:hypothetical protein
MHKYSDIFASLRAENNLEDDAFMASFINMVGRPEQAADIADVLAGCEFAAEIARAHGVEGVRSLYRATGGRGSALDEDDVRSDERMEALIESKSDKFIKGITVFCEQSGVVN